MELKNKEVIAIMFLVLVILLGGILFIGQFGNFYTNTVGVQKENARRNLFENSNSYIKGKERNVLKLYQEWLKEDEEGRLAVEAVVVLETEDFDENKLSSPKLIEFVEKCKYK